MELTELEKEFITMFDGDIEEANYLCRVYDYTNITESQISGVVSSLIKKGLILTDYEGTEDHIVYLSGTGMSMAIDMGLDQ